MSYRDVPGIDCAYLAMDTEEGVEVVWNEATFSETKKFKVVFVLFTAECRSVYFLEKSFTPIPLCKSFPSFQMLICGMFARSWSRKNIREFFFRICLFIIAQECQVSPIHPFAQFFLISICRKFVCVFLPVLSLKYFTHNFVSKRHCLFYLLAFLSRHS